MCYISAEYNKFNIYYYTRTDHVIQARRPDIVVKIKELDNMWLIDIAVPGDGRVKDKNPVECEKYQDLVTELRKIWNKSVTVVPIVVETLEKYTV